MRPRDKEFDDQVMDILGVSNLSVFGVPDVKVFLAKIDALRQENADLQNTIETRIAAVRLSERVRAAKEIADLRNKLQVETMNREAAEEELREAFEKELKGDD